VVESVRHQARNARSFFLGKSKETVEDSRRGRGLVAELAVSLKGGPRFPAGGEIELGVVAKNTSGVLWLPRSEKVGGVGLGVKILAASPGGAPTDFARLSLTPGDGVPIRPGEKVSFDARIPCPVPGAHELEFDLVAEHVVWFKTNGSASCRFRIEVTP
jgi:hypothetical protein